MQYDGVRLEKQWQEQIPGQLLWRWCQTMLALLLLTVAVSAHSAPKTVLVLGDSLSAEYGLVRGSGWVALLEQRLRQEHIDAVIVNASISGETTSGGKSRLPALLAQHKPALVVIELGANDALRGLQLNASRDNLQALIDLSRQAKAQVLLIGMQIPPNYGLDYTSKFTQLFAAAAKKNKVALVPFLLKDVADKPELFQADRLHPIAQAQGTLLNNVWPYLRPLLK